MSRRKPVQKRSRERIEQILLAAADQLAKAGTADDLTTTSVAKRSGVPVATIYRYFTDRVAIIAELIDRETAEIDGDIQASIEKLDRVSLDGLLHAMMYAHLKHFQRNRRSVVLWFGARQSKKVIGRIERRYDYMSEWLIAGTIKAGLVRPDAPEWGGEMIVWQCDRVFEQIFRRKRSRDEEAAIMSEFLEMISHQISKYATPAGVEGIATGEYLRLAGSFEPPYGDGDETS